jgi:hypothetical protein
MAVYTTAHLVLEGDNTNPDMRTDPHFGHGFLTWDNGSVRIDISAYEPEAMQQLADAAAALATSMRRAREVAA